MSDDVVIRVEGLGKKYTITHKRQERYTALRDVLAERTARLARRALAPFSKNGHAAAGPTREEFWALRDVSFEVKRGEVLGIIGRNGAGKSTLLKLLSRITAPTTGRIELSGRVASLLEVGTGFHPELTGRENISLNGAILGMTRAEIKRKFDEIVAFAEVDKFLDTPVKRYSSGMYVRLAFAVAAHLEPEILLVDEVLAVGDAQFQKRCLNKMSEMGVGGRTVLFVSHNMPAITRLCDRGILLERGELAADHAAVDTVAQYMRRSADAATSRSWDTHSSPGTDELQLRHIGLYRRDGFPSPTVVSVGDDLHFRIRYRVTRPRLRFRVGVNLLTQGVCAFGTIEPVEAERDRVGIYESIVEIPAHLLAEGEYTVTLRIFNSRGVKSAYVLNPDILAFQVVDPMDGTSARGDYTERFDGVVRPHLSWHLSFIDTDQHVQPWPATATS